MNSSLLKNIARFVFLVLIQVMVFNNMNLSGYINPSVYLMFILLLPVHINKSALLILAFLLGITIDFFSNTMGLHAAATVFMAFARPGTINLFFKNLEFTGKENPVLNKTGLGGFVRYTLALVLVHHTALFILEIFSFHDFLYTAYRILLSSLVSTFVIVILAMLFNRRS
jgi:rod shape-determining protein MreD